MDDLMLPPLPTPHHRFAIEVNALGERMDYTAKDMRDYAKKAVEAEALKISEAMRKVGLTLVITANGYHVMNLGQITAGPPR